MVREPTEAANEGRVWHEGLSFASFEGKHFLFKDAVAEAGDRLVGKAIFKKYNRWPVYSKFFDNMGPIPHHMHQSFEHAKLTGQEGKPESYYFPPQYKSVDNNFCYTFMGLEPGTTKDDVRRCLQNWNKGDNGILDLSRAYRLQRGTRRSRRGPQPVGEAIKGIRTDAQGDRDSEDRPVHKRPHGMRSDASMLSLDGVENL